MALVKNLWTQEQYEKVRSLRERGMSMKKAALAAGVSVSCVRTMEDRNGEIHFGLASFICPGCERRVSLSPCVACAAKGEIHEAPEILKEQRNWSDLRDQLIKAKVARSLLCETPTPIRFVFF